MGGIAGQIQQVANTVGQVPQQPGQPVGGIPAYAQPHYNSLLNNQPQTQPMAPQTLQYGQIDPQLQPGATVFNGVVPQQPGQTMGNIPPYAQPYYNALLNNMPQRPGFGGDQVYAGGNPNFNEATGQYNPIDRPNVVQPGPNVFPPGMDINQIKEMYRGQPRQTQPQGPQRPFNPRPYPGQGNDMAIAPPYNPNAGIEQVRANPQRGLGGLQLNKFRNRLDQR